MHVTHTKKNFLYYAYVLQNCPAVEFIVCGAQLWESSIFENCFNSEIREGKVGNWTIDLYNARPLLYHWATLIIIIINLVLMYLFWWFGGSSIGQVIKLLTILDKIIWLWIYVPVKVMFDCCETVLKCFISLHKSINICFLKINSKDFILTNMISLLNIGK